MPLFRCEQCGCVENTALSNYWTRNIRWGGNNEKLNNPALCSECDPEINLWHGKFPKRQWDAQAEANSGIVFRPPARTVTRQLTKIEIPPAQFGESSRIGYLASEVDPLLSALAAQDDEIAELKADLLVTREEVAFYQNTTTGELRTALAERAQEIADAITARDDAQAVAIRLDRELHYQIDALTARAEAAEATLAKLTAEAG